MKCEKQTEVYARVCGFFRPVEQWNKGKKSEFTDRKEYVPNLGEIVPKNNTVVLP